MIGVGSPEAARGRGNRRQLPDAVAGRLRTPIADSRKRGGGAKGAARLTVSPRTLGRRMASPFPPPIQRRRRMGAKRPGWPGVPCRRQGEVFHALFRRFATTSGFANPLPVSRRHLYAVSFLIIRDLKAFCTVPGTFPNTSGSRILLPVQHPRPEIRYEMLF